METFRQAAVLKFRTELVEHAQRFIPNHAKLIGERRLREVVELGCERAATFGFTQRGPVRFYIELMLMLGRGFDSDPQFPWAGKTLRSDLSNELEKSDLLFDRFQEYQSAVAGPGNAHAADALARLAGLRPCDLQAAGESPGSALDAMKSIHSRKFEYVGEPALRNVAETAVQAARSFGITSQPGIGLLSILMFAAGHECFRDPLFPWISGSLHDDCVQEPEARVDVLYHATVDYSKRMLERLGGRDVPR
jgi:hypothetical protein